MNRGFTLIELLVTIAIFTIIIGGILGIFIAGIRQQKIALLTQTLLDQTSFALEFLSRSLRMAQKELGQGCLSQPGSNYELTHQGAGVRFINALENGDCQEFFFESGKLKYWKSSTGQELPLTSDKLEITSFKFNLIGEGQQDNLQSRLSLFFAARGKTPGVTEIKVQTTISQRNLDVSQ